MEPEQAALQPNQVELSLPADGRFVAALRSVTTTLAAQCELTIDDIEDLQIAVHESCALLLPHTLPGGRLTARLVLAAGSVEVVVSAPAASHAQPDRTTFSWSALSGLSDRLEVTSVDGVLAIDLVKVREAQPL